MAPRQVVNAPAAGAPRVGIVASAVSPSDPGDWENGLTYEIENCYSGDLVAPFSGDDTKDDPSPPATVEWEPYVAVATYRCTALAARGKDWDGIVRRRLEATRSTQIEKEIWTGDKATAKGWPNLFLASPLADDLTEGGGVPLLQALACLEEYLASFNGGQQGMIHATSDVVSRWFSLNVLRREGARIFTLARDSVVVPGGGYDGSGTDGQPAANGDVWAYATDMVELRQDAVQIIGRPDDPSFIDRTTNKATIRAEQLVLASWDGCRHGAVRIDIDICDIGGS